MYVFCLLVLEEHKNTKKKHREKTRRILQLEHEISVFQNTEKFLNLIKNTEKFSLLSKKVEEQNSVEFFFVLGELLNASQIFMQASQVVLHASQ